MKKFLPCFALMCMLLSVTSVQAQQQTVRGTVTDAQNGRPIANVSVSVKGTSSGTVTDTSGSYEIAVPAKGNELEFSHGNYVTEKASSRSGIINIRMTTSAQQLGEVVVIGYGDIKRKAVTGAVSSANLDAFRESPNTSIFNSLHGSVPGLNVGITTSAGEESDFTIRGTNSISGSQTPLVVLDGIIYHGLIGEINPNDIQSIDILKDASSAAVYGSQAANGVILVTSKKGHLSDKPTITYSERYIQRVAADIPAYYSGEEYVQLYRDWDWVHSRTGPDYTTPNPDFDVTQYMFRPEKESWDKKRFTNWYDLVTQKGRIYQNDISVSGANDRTSYFLSASTFDQKDVLINDKYKRTSARINIETKITNWLKIGTNSFLSNNDYSGSEANGSLAYYMPPLAYPYNDDGSLVLNPSGYFFLNPLLPLQVDNLATQLQINSMNYAEVKLPFIKGLTYRINYANQYTLARDYAFDPTYSNNFGSAGKTVTNNQDWTLDNIVHYNAQFRNHHIDGTLLYGREQRTGEGGSESGQGFTNTILGYNGISSAQIKDVSSFSWKEASLYQMGRVNYSFMDRYFATVTVRRDGFSGFGDNKKFGIFPSVALAYVPSETTWFRESLPEINYLKLRSSYGLSGNRTVGRYSTLAIVSSHPAYIFGDGGNTALGQYVSTLANPNLGWETTAGLNIGVDFEILKGRVGGNIEYYNTNTHDLLYNVTIPDITGFSSVATNIGKLHNNGLEFQLTMVNIKTRQFQWRTTINFSQVKNKVVSILGLDLDGDGKEDDLVSSNLFIDRPLGTIYDYKIVGMYQIKDEIPSGYKPGYYRLDDLNKDGVIDPSDREFLGNAEPAYRAGLLNELQYKSFDLRFFINTVQGGKHGYYGYNSPNQDGDNIMAPTKNIPKAWNYWTPEIPNAEYPALNYLPPIGGDVYRQRNFVRLQDVTLSYKLNPAFTRKAGLKEVSIFVNGQNLHVWTKWKGWDPETGAGLDSGRPIIRSYTGGINVSL